MNSYFAFPVQDGRNFAFPVQNVLKGIGKTTALISTAGKKPSAQWTKQVRKWKSNFSAMCSAVEIGDVWSRTRCASRDMSHQDKVSSQGDLTHLSAWQWLYSQRWASIGGGKLVVAHGAGDSQHLQPKEEQVDAGVVQGQERCVLSAASAP